jgi:hypothetical protein
MQTGVNVTDDAITGTLKFISGGLAASGPLTGDGNFLALKFSSDDWAGYTSVKVGLVPSASGMALVEVLTDPDKNGVFKVSNTDQIFRVEAHNGARVTTLDYSLKGLILETE